ncbi:hypothetical protein NMG60_11027562 [Bertholletia excelsa]
MRATLLRSGSIPAQHQQHHHSFGPGSSRASASPSLRDSGVKTGQTTSPVSLHFSAARRDDYIPNKGITRMLSVPDLIRTPSFPARVPVEEPGFPGGGIGKGIESGGNGDAFAGGGADRSKIDAYYQEMLKSDPSNPLLLRNYARFLHEVVKDTVKAEEYYGRAILASPGDGEVLSLYAKLILETERDENRAKSYFDQAVLASPHDCMVLGSYAHFMWEAGDEDGELDGGSGELQRENEFSAAMVEALKP